MKYLFTILLSFYFSCSANAYYDTLYVAVTDGIKLYSGRDTNTSVISRYKYGEKVVVNFKDIRVLRRDDQEIIMIRVEQEKGKISGHVVLAHLTHLPPPENCNSLKDYANQLSSPAYPPVTTSDTRTLYQNGMILIEDDAYNKTVTLIIPDISVIEGYLITQNITELVPILPENKSIPVKSTERKPDSESMTIVTYEYSTCNYAGIREMEFINFGKEPLGSITLKQMKGNIAIIYSYSTRP